jgi:hypothetical protein
MRSPSCTRCYNLVAMATVVTKLCTLREVRTIVIIVFTIRTGCVFYEARDEAEEIVEHRAHYTK